MKMRKSAFFRKAPPPIRLQKDRPAMRNSKAESPPPEGLFQGKTSREFIVLTVLLFYAIAATYPLIVHLFDRLPGWPGDNLYFHWELWWFKRAILDLRISPLRSPDLYYPVGMDLSRDEVMPSNTLLGLPLTALLGPTAAYNLLLLASFVLTGYGIYRIVFEGTGNRWAGLLAGIAASIAPYRMTHLAGHLNLMATQWIVLTLLFLGRWFKDQRPGTMILAGLFFALNGLAAWYYFYIGTFTVGFYLLLRSWPLGSFWRQRRAWSGLLVFGLISLLLVLPFALPMLKLRDQGLLERSISGLEAYGASPANFLLPNPWHPLWGNLTWKAFSSQWGAVVEQNLTLGGSVLLLAALGTMAYFRNREVRLWLFLAVFSAILAMGPTLKWNNQRWEFYLPALAVQWAEQTGFIYFLDRWVDPQYGEAIRAGKGFVPLPLILFYAWVPLTSSMRALVRFGWITFLSVTVLAGYGIHWILSKITGRRVLTWGFLAMGFVLVPLELWTQIGKWTSTNPRPVDRWLAAQPRPSPVIEYPFLDNFSARLMLAQTVHQQPLIMGGLPPSFHPRELYERSEGLRDFPSPDGIKALQGWRTRYILATPVHFSGDPAWQEFRNKLARFPEVRLVMEINGVWVYEIKF
jgi:hypothetical protein